MLLHRLPAKPLRLIFSHLPLRELFILARLRSESTSWLDLLQDAAAKQTTSREGAKLILLLGPKNPDVPELPTYSTILHLVSLDKVTVKILVQFLGKIEILSISVRKTRSYIFTHLIYLLTAWSPTLTSLSLFFNLQDTPTPFWCPIISERCHGLLFALNLHCTRLRALTLHFHGYLFVPSKVGNLKFPILEQLELFKFYSLDSAQCLFASLRDFGTGPNGTLEVLSPIDASAYTALLTLPTSVSSKIQKLNENLTLDFSLVDAFALKFQNLKRINLFAGKAFGENLEPVFASLSTLPALKHLELIIESIRSHKWSRVTTQLSAVLNLKLSIETTSHWDLAVMGLDKIFPSLVRLQIIETPNPHQAFSCNRCQWWEEVLLGGEGVTRVNECLEKMFRCLLKCPQLEEVWFECEELGYFVDYRQWWQRWEGEF